MDLIGGGNPTTIMPKLVGGISPGPIERSPRWEFVCEPGHPKIRRAVSELLCEPGHPKIRRALSELFVSRALRSPGCPREDVLSSSYESFNFSTNPFPLPMDSDLARFGLRHFDVPAKLVSPYSN